jgi:hypothetical protein
MFVIMLICAALVEARSLVSYTPALSRLFDAFFAGRNERTLAAYRADLGDFSAFAGTVPRAKPQTVFSPARMARPTPSRSPTRRT